LKYISKVLVIVFIFNFFINSSVPIAYGWDQNDEITSANNYIESIFGYPGYYVDNSKIKTTDNKENLYGLNKQLLINGQPAFHNKPLFLYGTPEESTNEYFSGKRSGSPAGKYSDLNKEWRTLGFTMEGCPYPNPWFPNDYYVVNGKEVTNSNDSFKEDKSSINLTQKYSDDSGKYWIKDPYGIIADGNDKRELSRAMPDGTIKKTIEVGTADMINSWVRTTTFQPTKMKNDRQLLSRMAVNPPKSLKNNFEDYLAVLSPPTDNSWGIGIAFYYKFVNGVLHSRYSTFYLRPKNMLKNDLFAEFEYDSPKDPKKKVDPGKEVSVGITLDSTYNKALTGVSYKLKVTNNKGEIVPHNIVKPNDIITKDDKMDLPGSWTMFYINFTMPESPVNIEFSINPDGKNPDEDIISNNVISTKFLPTVFIPFDFDYNIIKRSVGFKLDKADNVATISLPDGGTWKGNATGSLNVTNGTPDLFKNFQVDGNLVNEAGTRFPRNPNILTTFYRESFGDNPQNNIWLSGPQSISKYGLLPYQGLVSRLYDLTYTDGCVLNADGTTSCPGHTIHNLKEEGSFKTDTSKCRITAHVYNGKPLDTKKYTTDIANNTATNKDKKMLWPSKLYNFNVIRMMYHKDINNNLTDRVEVPGQFSRSFVNQNDATTNWKVSSSMKADYKTSRDAARKMSKNKRLLEKAVFASDKAFQKFDYPIKSGYYFNPTGTYTFKITTNIYKTTSGNTTDHKEIVDAFLDAFRYESNIVYKNKNGQAVDIQNNQLKKGTKGYVGRPAVLSFNDPKGLDNKVWLEQTTTFSKDKVETIEFPDPKNINELADSTKVYTIINKDDVTSMDDRWKDILEGYTQSNTHDSFSKFRYREYVARNQTLYKITETSTVTIKVNPNDYKAYTHDAMADGDYKVKVYIDDISFKGHTNVQKNLEIMKGIANLDDIDIEVVGSKSDDINVN